MMCAYDRLYLADAMAVLAEFFEYAVDDYGAEGDEVSDLFCMSPLSDMFAKGNPSVVSGLSGPELFARFTRELGYDDAALPKPLFRFEKTPHYWAGWVAAYVQWRLALSFDELFRVMPYDELVARYHPWHEASEEHFCELFVEMARDSEREFPRGSLSRAASCASRNANLRTDPVWACAPSRCTSNAGRTSTRPRLKRCRASPVPSIAR